MNFIAELKEMSGRGKSEQEHVPHFLHVPLFLAKLEYSHRVLSLVVCSHIEV